MSGRSTSRRLRIKNMPGGPFDAGLVAYKALVSRDMNPYGRPLRGSRGKGHAWDKGWLEGRRIATQTVTPESR